MDIRDWPMDKIMQLPDEVFGRRWPIILGASVGAGSSAFRLSELGLPERSVLWEIHGSERIFSDPVNALGSHILLALGDQVPLGFTQFAALEDLLANAGVFISGHYSLTGHTHLTRLRMPIASGGRRVIADLINDGGATTVMQVELVFSSVPNEISDFYAGVSTDQLDEIVRLLRLRAGLP